MNLVAAFILAGLALILLIVGIVRWNRRGEDQLFWYGYAVFLALCVSAMIVGAESF